jgi:hypothetical protein
VILLVKAPVPVPSLVLVLSAIVGLVVVPHTTPRAVTAAPPSEVIFPPLVAVVWVMLLTVVVVSVGKVGAEKALCVTVTVRDTFSETRVMRAERSVPPLLAEYVKVREVFPCPVTLDRDSQSALSETFQYRVLGLVVTDREVLPDVLPTLMVEALTLIWASAVTVRQLSAATLLRIRFPGCVPKPLLKLMPAEVRWQ